MNEALLVAATQQHQLAEEARSLNSRFRAFVTASSRSLLSTFSAGSSVPLECRVGSPSSPTVSTNESLRNPGFRPRLFRSSSAAFTPMR